MTHVFSGKSSVVVVVETLVTELVDELVPAPLLRGIEIGAADMEEMRVVKVIKKRSRRGNMAG